MRHTSFKTLALLLFLSFFLCARLASAEVTSVKQGEVLLYPINYSSGSVSVFFGGVKMPVFDYASHSYALIAADVSKPVGNYNLRIKEGKGSFADLKELEIKVIPVTKGKYPQTLTKVAYQFTTLPKDKQAAVVKDKAPLVALLTKAVAEATPKIWQSIFRNPLDAITVTSSFGYKRIYTNYSTVHQGVDLRAKVGTPVYAISDGKVLWGAEEKALYLEGPMIAIDHGDGIVSKYLHLSKVLVKDGAEVKAGDIIGYSGDQGADVQGAHLHFAIKVGDASVSPLQFVKEFQKIKAI